MIGINLLCGIAIVTRAALKGMADSVGVFIPILQEAADNVKESVNQARYQVMEHNRNLLKDDTAASGMDSLSEEDQNQPSNGHMLEITSSADEGNTQQQIESSYVTPPSIIQPVVASTSVTTNSATKTFERATPSSSVSSSTTALEKSTDFGLNVPTKQQQKAKRLEQQPEQNAANMSTKSISPRPTTQKLQQTEPTPEKHWSSTIADHILINLKTVMMLALIALTVYMSTIWVRSGHRMADKADEFLHLNMTLKDTSSLGQQPIYLQKSTSRSVYLRDLDEGFLKNTIQPPYANSIRYLNWMVAIL